MRTFLSFQANFRFFISLLKVKEDEGRGYGEIDKEDVRGAACGEYVATFEPKMAEVVRAIGRLTREIRQLGTV